MKLIKNIIVIILIIIILGFIAYSIYWKLPNSLIKTGIIVSNENGKVIVKSSVDTTKIDFIFYENNDIKVKNIDGKRIDISDLNIGDKIKVNYKEEKIKRALHIFPTEIKNIKLIEKIESNNDNHFTEDDLLYNNFEIYTNFKSKDSITLIINQYSDDIEGSLPINLEAKILKISNENTSEYIEIKQYNDDEISYNIFTKFESNIEIQNKNDEMNLEIGKYVLRIEGDKLGVIKVPFEIDNNNNILY